MKLTIRESYEPQEILEHDVPFVDRQPEMYPEARKYTQILQDAGFAEIRVKVRDYYTQILYAGIDEDTNETVIYDAFESGCITYYSRPLSRVDIIKDMMGTNGFNLDRYITGTTDDIDEFIDELDFRTFGPVL